MMQLETTGKTLNDGMKSTLNVLQEWKSNQKLEKKTSFTQHEMKLVKNQDEKQALQSQYQQEQERLSCSQQENLNLHLQQMSLSDSVVQLQMEMESFLPQVNALQKEIGIKEKEKKEKIIMEKRVSATENDQLLEMNKGLLQYENSLGMKIHLQDGNKGFHITFTQIDEMDSNKEYSIHIDLQRNAYHVVSCTPSIGDLPTLVQELNRTDDLATFMKVIRRRFKAYYIRR